MAGDLILLREQILLEVGKILTHGDALFLASHEGSQTIRNCNVDTQNLIYLFLELGRMSCLAEDTIFTFLQTIYECLIAASAMRIKNITRFLIALAHSLADPIITVCGTADDRCDSLMTLAVQVVDACEV